MNKIITGMFCIAFLVSLAGCTPSIAFTGAQAVYEHHSLNNAARNQLITLQAYQAVAQDKALSQRVHVNIATYNYILLLAGQASTQADKQQVEKIVNRFPDVKRIINDIQITEPISLAQQLNDSWLTTQVIAQMVTNNDVDPSHIKVVSENGIVYLMGIVPKNQGEIAIDITRQTFGVEKVVTLLQYVNYDNA